MAEKLCPHSVNMTRKHCFPDWETLLENMAEKLCPILGNMTKKHCFPVWKTLLENMDEKLCPHLVNMTKKHCFLVWPPSKNMARKECLLVFPPSGNIAKKPPCLAFEGRCEEVSTSLEIVLHLPWELLPLAPDMYTRYITSWTGTSYCELQHSGKCGPWGSDCRTSLRTSPPPYLGKQCMFPVLT
jgi:hypothetical protein